MEMYLNKAAAQKGEEYQKFQRKKGSPEHVVRFSVYCLTASRYLWTKNSGLLKLLCFMSLETDLHRNKKTPVSSNSHVNILSSVKVLFQIDQITYIELTHGSPDYPVLFLVLTQSCLQVSLGTSLQVRKLGAGRGRVTLIPDSKLSPF